MSFTPKQMLAAQRSHEDAKATNALFQAAAQAAILINGGAATATLTFSTAASAPVHVQPSFLGSALATFAIGVVFGTLVIVFQALAVQKWMVRWEGEALGYSRSDIDESISKASRFGTAVQALLIASATAFLIGCLILSSVLWFKAQST